MDRINGIISILLDNEHYITIDKIAEKLKVSNKTIRNELKLVESFLKEKGASIEKKPGIGIKLVADNETRMKILEYVRPANPYIEAYSPELRKNYIIKRLLIKKSNITIADLARELYVSKMTIYKDIDFAEEWLKKFKLELIRKPNYGIEVIGSEENLRNAIAFIIANDKNFSELEEILISNVRGRIDYKIIEKLRELVDLDFRQLEKLVTETEEKLGFRFADDAFTSLVIHIAISIKRLKDGKDIHLSEDVLKGLRNKEEYQTAVKMTKSIEKIFGIKFPESEVGYILLHILGTKMQQNKRDDFLSIIDNKNENDISVIMAKEIVDIAQRALGMDFEGDMQFVNGLILHLRPTVNRLKYGLTLRNPILGEIKDNYSEVFGVAWMSSTVFSKYLGVKIPEEEIGYIALHIGAAIERNRKPLKVLIVCSSGIGTAQLLAARIEKSFRDIEVVDTISALMLNEMESEKIDFIISTIPIETNKPVITVKPILSQNDIKKIENYISYLKSRKNNRLFKNLLDIELIYLHQNFSSQFEVLDFMAQELLKRNYVENEYIKSLCERENLTFTSIGNGVAIPHGNPNLVKESKISIMTLNNPILWGNEKVDLIIMVSIASKDLNEAKLVFRRLYEIIDEPSFLIDIKNSTSSIETKKILEGVLNVN